MHAADVRNGARLECFPNAPYAPPGIPTHDQPVVHDGLGHVLSPVPASSLPSSAPLLRTPESARTLRGGGLGLHALAHADASAHAACTVDADGRQRPARLGHRQPHRSGHGGRFRLCGGSVPSSAAAAADDPAGGIAGTGGHDGNGSQTTAQPVGSTASARVIQPAKRKCFPIDSMSTFAQLFCFVSAERCL